MSSAAPLAAAVLALACVVPGRGAAQTPGARPAAPTPPASAPAVRDLPLTPAERQAYVGTYNATLPQGGGGPVQIYLDGNALRMRPAGEREAPRLLYQGGQVFHAEGMPDFVITFTLAQGRATGFSVQKEDGVIQATRVP